MDERRYNQKLPWDESIYGTGRTRPRKSHGGLIALLLMLVIFLSGVVGFLSIMNVRLLSKLNDAPAQENHPMFFSAQEEISTDPTDHTSPARVDPGEEDSMISIATTPNSVENLPQEGGLSLQQIYEKNLPSVVSIICYHSGGTTTGSGVVLTEDGYIVTNSHVVAGAQSISIRLSDNSSFSARLVGDDSISDLAVLSIDAEGLTPAQFGDSDALRVGDTVVAIGDPLGMQFSGTMTDGIVSAIERDVTVNGRIMTLIQTNAALNSGNSGGPLINCYGQVIGINTMKIGTFADKAGVEGIGFAIPSTTVKEIVDQLVTQGYVSGRPTLGITGEAVSGFYQYYYRMPPGLYITHVEEESDAESKGISPGDIIISINDIPVSDMDGLNSVIYLLEVGDTVDVQVYHAGERYTLKLTLTEDKA